MKRKDVLLMVFFILCLSGCRSTEEISEVRDLSHEVVELGSTGEKVKENREEIILNRPRAKLERKTQKEKKEVAGLSKTTSVQGETWANSPSFPTEDSGRSPVTGELKEKDIPEKDEKEAEEKPKEEEKKDEEMEFVFEPYYSAPIGSQGLFPDSASATEEGWRVSEMDDPSAYLGFTPRGWEVYPVWYYSAPDKSEIFYTLNFYP